MHLTFVLPHHCLQLYLSRKQHISTRFHCDLSTSIFAYNIVLFGWMRFADGELIIASEGLPISDTDGGPLNCTGHASQILCSHGADDVYTECPFLREGPAVPMG